MKELPLKRSLYGKTFELSPGVEQLVVNPTPVHTLKDGVYIDLDPTIVTKNGKEVCETMPYNFELKGLGFRLDYKTSYVEVAINAIDGTKVSKLTLNTSNQVKSGNEVWFIEVLPGLDIGFQVNRLGVRTLKRIKNATAPRSFTWDIKQNGLELSAQVPKGRDNETEQERGDIPNRRLIEIVSSQTEAAGTDDKVYQVSETWTGKVYSRNKKTRVLELTDDPIYPIILDPTFGPSSAGNNDDGYESVAAGTFNGSSYGWYVGTLSGGAVNYNGGIRFTNVTVPQGATISAAKMTFDIEDIYNVGPHTANLTADNVDDAPAWSNSSRPSSGYTATTAIVSWTIAESISVQDTSDIKTVVQEIVNRAGWVSGNAMRFALITAMSGQYFKVDSETDGPIGTLTITYSTGGAANTGFFALM